MVGYCMTQYLIVTTIRLQKPVMCRDDHFVHAPSQWETMLHCNVFYWRAHVQKYFWSHEFYIWILGIQEYHSKQKIGSKNQQNSNRVTLVVLKPEYSRQTRSKQCTSDISWLCILRHWIYHGIQAHHDYPSQMYENLLIYRVKRLAIASVLTPLINKFECICEGHVWWVCITKWSSSKYRKNILICRIFHFCGWQIILWWHSMEPFDCAWFGCCPSGRIPSDDYGIPTCNSNDVTRSAVGLTQAASRWKQMRTHAPKRRECAF